MTGDDRLLSAVRDASAVAADPGAAARIAERAWTRAAELRASRGPRLRVARRAAWVAAATVLLAAGALALRGPETAFAVEGDPVDVMRGDEWTSATSVPAGCLVRVPDGSRVLRAPGGGAVRPQPGSLLRFVELAAPARRFRVEIRGGRAEVEGVGFDVATEGDAIVVRDAGPSAFRVTVSLDGRSRTPRVTVGEGRASVLVRATGETLFVDPQETAGLVAFGGGPATPRLAKIERWTPDFTCLLAGGGFSVLDANPEPHGGLMFLGRASAGHAVGVEVAAGDVRDALRQYNACAVVRAAACSPGGWTRYAYRNGATRVEVLVADDGAVRVDDGAVRRHASLAALRRAEPAVAALFGDSLPR